MELQQQMYNGWIHAHSIVSIILTGPDGCILYFYGNVVGSHHDAWVFGVSGLPNILAHFFNHGKRVLSDTGYPRVDGTVRIHKTGELQMFNAQVEEEITQCRTAAEWINNIWTSTFRRLKTDLPVNPKQRANILKSTMLQNLKTRKLGLNQIRDYFYKEN
jgi:hypothetical protein